MSTEQSLLEALLQRRTEGWCPMHMPGHKQAEGLPEQLPYGIDITEIEGFDDLHDPQGLLLRAQQNAARLWGAQQSFFLVNGSTGGLLAGIRAAAPAGSRVIVARNCHKAVYHALELCGLRPVYLLPEWDESFGIFGSVTPAALQAALDDAPDARLVILTSPTYEGAVSDIASLAALCHARGIPLLVDEAHGAHLGFCDDLPPGAVAGGADLVVQSLHKTLPSLTQTGLLHCGGALVSPRRVARELGVFQTSSPSYPLMAAIDGCVRILQASAGPLFQNYLQNLRTLSQDLAQLTALRVLGKGLDGGHPAIFAADPGKLVVSTRGTALTGPRLAARLREEYRIEPEMAAPDYLLLMTSPCDSEENFARVDEALLTIDEELTRQPLPPAAPPALPPLHQSAAQALAAPARALPAEQAVGRVAAEYLWAYPPGVPLLVPGEEITPAALAQLQSWRLAGVHVVSTSGALPLLACAETE